MDVTHEPVVEVQPHPLWTRPAYKPPRRGWLIGLLAGVVVLVVIIFISANAESTGPLTVSAGKTNLARLWDGGNGVQNQGSTSTFGASAAFGCVVNGEPVYVYVFSYNVDGRNAVSLVSNGAQQEVVVGPNWIATVAPSLAGSRGSNQTAKLIQNVFGGVIHPAKSGR